MRKLSVLCESYAFYAPTMRFMRNMGGLPVLRTLESLAALPPAAIPHKKLVPFPKYILFRRNMGALPVLKTSESLAALPPAAIPHQQLVPFSLKPRNLEMSHSEMSQSSLELLLGGQVLSSTARAHKIKPLGTLPRIPGIPSDPADPVRSRGSGGSNCCSDPSPTRAGARMTVLRPLIYKISPLINISRPQY